MALNPMSDEARTMKPADRMAKGLCPECGLAVDKKVAIAHRNAHWPRKLSDEERDEKARERYVLLSNYAKAADAPGPEAKSSE